MPDALHLKTEEVDTPEKRGKYTLSVVGCGQQGILIAMAFAGAGFKVICTDADQSVVKRLSKGNVRLADRDLELKLKGFFRAGQLMASSDLKNTVNQSDIIIIKVNPKIDAKKNPAYSEVESICKQIGESLHKGTLVFYGGIAGFGLTDGTVKETLENTSGLKVGEDFGLAYSPVQYSAEHGSGLIGDHELRVAASDKVSLNAATTVYETVAKKGVKKIPETKAAELASLFQAAKRDALVALINELAIFCESASMDYAELVKLLDNDAFENSHGPTIAEEENRSEAYLLLESAENLNAKLRMPALARQVNEDMVKYAVNLTQEALRSCEKPLRRARVALLGIVEPTTGAAEFVEMLETKGSRVTRYDPQGVESEQAEGKQTLRRTLNEAVEGTDCIVVLTGQDQFKRLNFKKLRAIMRSPAALVDLVGVVEPSKAEAEGFTYRGLGRGVWKK